MDFIKNLIWPREQNRYSPLLTKSTTILAFAVVVFLSNIVMGRLHIARGAGQVDANEIVQLHNRERQAIGLNPLSINTLLNKSAQAKADAMLASDCWSHYCPEGKSPWDFFDDAGYIYIYAGENLAQGFYDNESVMQAWMNSPTHKENVIKDDFTEIGIGIAYGTFQGVANNIVIAVHFGTRLERMTTPSNEEFSNSDGQMEKPVILYPEEGAVTNNNKTEVSGEAKNAHSVEVIQNDEDKGDILVDGGIFTYRPITELPDGNHTFKVVSQTENGVKGASSDLRSFTVDTEMPVLLDDEVRAKAAVLGEYPQVTLEISVNETLNIARVEVSGETFIFKNASSLKWETDVDKQVFESGNPIKVYLEDIAGNKTFYEVNYTRILGLSQAMDEISIFETEKSSQNPFLAIVERLVGSNFNLELNLLFVVMFLMIIVVDFLALKETGLTAFKGKPHLHFTSLIVLIIVILLGGAGGTLLTGVNI